LEDALAHAFEAKERLAVNKRRALIVSADTTVNDLVEFLLSRAEPIRVGGCVIYDFNNHAFDEERFLESEIPPGKCVIPFSMSEVNLDLFALLPPAVARLPRLRFNPAAPRGGYSVVQPFLPADPAEERRLRLLVEEVFSNPNQP
jgi:hypothetical protein